MIIKYLCIVTVFSATIYAADSTTAKLLGSLVQEATAQHQEWEKQLIPLMDRKQRVGTEEDVATFLTLPHQGISLLISDPSKILGRRLDINEQKNVFIWDTLAHSTDQARDPILYRNIKVIGMLAGYRSIIFMATPKSKNIRWSYEKLQ